jgi:flavin-dependent dehydrogenase
MMDFEKYDVIIVGGGPAGCITGEHIKHGKVLIIEEHQEIGAPLQCAGLISKKGVEELGNPKGCVNKVRGAHIYSKNNHITVGNEEIRACVFERKVMDKDIAIRASKNKNVHFLLKAHGKLLINDNLKTKKLNLSFLKIIVKTIITIIIKIYMDYL